MRLSEIINCLENRFPKYNAENWDTVGFMIENKEREIQKIQISLDVTMKVIDNAEEKGVD